MWKKAAACVLSMVCGICAAKEVLVPLEAANDRDWTAADREAAQQILLAGDEKARRAFIKSVASGEAKNTFVQTVLPNIIERRSGEYKTIAQRSALYGAISAILKHHPNVPEALRSVRFFDAAAEVTGPTAIGALERWSNMVKLSEMVGVADPDAKEHLEVINIILVKRNFDVLRRVITEWRELRSPLLEWRGGPSPWPVIKGRIPADAFDLTMVLFEQETVERYITSTKMPDEVKASIDKTLSACDWFVAKQGFISVSRPLCEAQRWGAETGAPTKTFFDRRGRIATGQALIYMLHGMSKENYKELMTAQKAWLGSARKPSDLIFVGSPDRDSTFFAIVGSFKTQRGAERKRAELLARLPGSQFAIYPPKKPDTFWTVASAAYSSEAEAAQQVSLCRKSGAAPDAYLLSRSPTTSDGKPFVPIPNSLELPKWPTEPGARPNTVDPDTRLLLELRRFDDKRSADAAVRDLRARFPKAPVALMDVDGAERTFALIVGGFTDEIGIAQAQETARLLGFAKRSTALTQLPSGTLTGWVNRTEASSVAAASNAQRVIKCYGNAQQTVQSMLDCTGFILTPSTLLRCIQGALRAEDDCFPMTIDQVERTRGLKAFLAEQKIRLDDLLTVRVEDIPLPKTAQETETWAKKIYECRQVAGGIFRDKFEECISPILPRGGLTEAQVKCFAESKGDQARVAACIATSAGASTTTAQVECMARGRGDSLAQAKCLMSDEQRVAASVMQGCVASAADPLAAIGKCGVVALDKRQASMVECVSSGGRAAQDALACAAKLDPQLTQAAQKLECLRKAAGLAERQLACAAQGADPTVANAISLAQCTNVANSSAAQVTSCLSTRLGGDAGKAAQALTCLQSAAKDANKQLLCGASAVGGEAAALAACVKQAGADRQAMVVCALGKRPEAQMVAAAADCLKATGGAAERLTQCAAPFLPPEAREGVACAAKAGYSTGALAGCGAAQLLPPQYRRVANCVATNSSAVGMAVCAAGPAMNEDLRIAADCAAASGGEPITFTACAGGRLAVRELTGCFQSKIGDDGCFGKGNTLRQAFEAVGKMYMDAAQATGEALDDAGKAVVKAIEDVGQAVGHAAQQVADVGSKLTGGVVGVKDGCFWMGPVRLCDRSKNTPVCIFGVCAKK